MPGAASLEAILGQYMAAGVSVLADDAEKSVWRIRFEKDREEWVVFNGEGKPVDVAGLKTDARQAYVDLRGQGRSDGCPGWHATDRRRARHLPPDRPRKLREVACCRGVPAVRTPWTITPLFQQEELHGATMAAGGRRGASALSAAGGEEAVWSRFRGPEVTASARPRRCPRWTGADYNWNVRLPGVGHSSPVVWGKQIFLTSGDPRTAQRSVLSLDTAEGRPVAAGLRLEDLPAARRQQLRVGDAGRRRQRRRCHLEHARGDSAAGPGQRWSRGLAAN